MVVLLINGNRTAQKLKSTLGDYKKCMILKQNEEIGKENPLRENSFCFQKGVG